MDLLQLRVDKIDCSRMIVMRFGQSICHLYHADEELNRISGINNRFVVDNRFTQLIRKLRSEYRLHLGQLNLKHYFDVQVDYSIKFDNVFQCNL